MNINEIKTGQKFVVSSDFEDEWFYRGIWLRTDKENLAVNLRQGCNSIGTLKKFKKEIPLELET